MVVGERENPEQEPFPTTHASEHIETLCHGALPPLYRAVFCTGHTSKAVLQETLWSGFGVEAGLFQPRLRAALHPAADGEHFGLTPERLQPPPPFPDEHPCSAPHSHWVPPLQCPVDSSAGITCQGSD